MKINYERKPVHFQPQDLNQPPIMKEWVNVEIEITPTEVMELRNVSDRDKLSKALYDKVLKSIEGMG